MFYFLGELQLKSSEYQKLTLLRMGVVALKAQFNDQFKAVLEEIDQILPPERIKKCRQTSIEEWNHELKKRISTRNKASK